MAEYADLSIELEGFDTKTPLTKEDIFKRGLAFKKNEKIWVSRDGDINDINALETQHLENIDKMFDVMFKRLIRVKFELFKRKLGFKKSISTW